MNVSFRLAKPDNLISSEFNSFLVHFRKCLIALVTRHYKQRLERIVKPAALLCSGAT